MLNYIWAFMMIIAIVFGAVNRAARPDCDSGARGGKGRGYDGACTHRRDVLWSGLLKIAEEGGVINALRRLLRPVLRLLFPGIKPDSDAAGAIISNMSANLLGMGNAATPFGIKAMHELDRLSGHSGVASNAMCMFVVVNTASIQLIPTTMIAT